MEVNPEEGGSIEFSFRSSFFLAGFLQLFTVFLSLSLSLSLSLLLSLSLFLVRSLSLSLSCIVIATCFKVDQPLSAAACSKNESSFRGRNDLSLILGDASLASDRHRRSDIGVKKLDILSFL